MKQEYKPPNRDVLFYTIQNGDKNILETTTEFTYSVTTSMLRSVLHNKMASLNHLIHKFQYFNGTRRLNISVPPISAFVHKSMQFQSTTQLHDLL